MLVVMLLASPLLGCSPARTTATGSQLLNTPTPASHPPHADNYTPGEALLPPGSYLFIEALLRDEASGACLYAPSAQQPALGYEINSGVLVINWTSLQGGLSGLDNQEQVVELALKSVGFFGQRKTESYSLGGATIADISLMRELPASNYFPYKATDLPVIVEAVDEHGAAVVNVRGLAYRMAPDAEWQETQLYEPQPGCFVTRTITLVNHGLLSEDEIRFTDEPIV